MELVARTSPLPRRVAMMAALAALLITSAFAGATAAPAQAKKKAKAPVITKVSPMSVGVGQTLTIRGRSFLRGRNKTTVVFKRDGARAVFVKADLSTAKMLKLTVPASLQKYFRTRDGQAVPTRFRLRALTTRLGKKFTAAKRSPFIGPAPQPADAGADCDGDKVPNSADTDDDNDLLADTLETQIHTDPCKLDTDGDGIEDGYEYKSAMDLNDDDYQQPNTDLFYPAKTPYPNPLYNGDAGRDFDGDSLTLSEEQELWKYTYEVTHTDARTLTPLSYSDGEQFSRMVRNAAGRRQPILTPGNDDKRQQFLDWASASGYRTVMLRQWGVAGVDWQPFLLFDVDRRDGDEEMVSPDRDRDGYLSDDERDEDADGLSNYDEWHGRMLPSYWSKCYGDQNPGFTGTDAVDADSDGDGVRDGADDQDHDDVPNVMELSRILASRYTDHIGSAECEKRPETPANPLVPLTGANYGRVDPFNPCMPDPASRTCPRYVQDAIADEWYALN
jgi:hypothetical protein